MKKSARAGGGYEARARAQARIAAVRGRATQRYTRPVVTNTGDTKYFDCGINATVVSGGADWTASEVPCDNAVNSSGTAAAYTDSALIPSHVGSGYGQINGNSYRLKKLRVRGVVAKDVLDDQGAVPDAQLFRLMLVLDTMPSGAQAQGEDIMQDVGASETIFSYKRMADLGSRFRILKDLTGQLDPIVAASDHAALPSTASIAFRSQSFSFQYAPTVPMNVQIKSGNATPTIAGLVTANIFLLLHTEGTSCVIRASSRCYYADK